MVSSSRKDPVKFAKGVEAQTERSGLISVRGAKGNSGSEPRTSQLEVVQRTTANAGIAAVGQRHMAMAGTREYALVGTETWLPVSPDGFEPQACSWLAVGYKGLKPKGTRFSVSGLWLIPTHRVSRLPEVVSAGNAPARPGISH